MAVFPLQVFSQNTAQVGFDQPYKSLPLGTAHAGQPKGAYVGFTPSTLGSVLTLAIDPTFGYSAIKVDSDVNPSGMDVVVTSDVTLDFVGQPSIDFPMNVLVRVQYFADGIVPTTAEVFSRSDSVVVSDTEVLLCVVDGPAGALTIAFDVAVAERDEPLAYGHINYGFMPGGSIESLQAAADIVNEVIAARTCLNGTVHADLSTRIAVDYGAPAMAGRLALTFRALRSNDYAFASGQSEITISGSFSEIDRDHEPKITFEGTGDETAEGVLADPNDIIRNVALVVDAATGYRPVDDPTDRRVVFGRLVGPGETVVSGEWRFLNASKNVTATDGNGQAIVEIEVQDTVLGPDGKHYEVEGVSTDNTFELRTAYQGSTDTIAPTSIRRWKLQLKKIDGSNNEIPASLPTDATVRFFLPSFVSLERSNADWQLAMHTPAEREPLGAASTDVPGIVRLASSGALLGSISIQNAGAPLGGGPFHTINFNAANASVIPVPSNPGEVEVAEIGPQGAPGNPGASGGPGDPGGSGPGYNTLNPFEDSAEFGPGLGVAIPWSFTKDMGHNIRYLHGNVARWRDSGLFGFNADRLDILDVAIVTATEGRMEGTLGGVAGDVFLVAFLSSAGD